MAQKEKNKFSSFFLWGEKNKDRPAAESDFILIKKI
jgi:hypothetical protein